MNPSKDVSGRLFRAVLMNSRFFPPTLLAASAIALTMVLNPSQPAQAQSSRFFCDEKSDAPTTTAQTPRGNIPIIRWVSTLGEGSYDPITRCRTVSSRFQTFHEKRLLRFLTTGRMNGQNVVCVALERNGACLKDGLLFTLKPGSNPRRTLLQLVNVSTRAAGPLQESSGERVYIDMDEFLNTAASEQPKP